MEAKLSQKKNDMYMDMSEFMMQKKEAKQQKIISEVMLKNLPGGYYRCSIEEGFPFLYIGGRFLDMLGWTEEEIKEKFDNRFFNLVHPDDKELVLQYADRIASVENSQKYKYQEQIYRIVCKDGYRWIAETSMYMNLKEDNFYQGFIFDVTPFIEKREQQEQELQMLRKQQLNSLASQLDMERKYLDVLTHDFSVVYDVNLMEDTSKLIKVDSQVICYDVAKVSLRQVNKYSERVDMYSKKFVAPSFQQEFRRVMDSENLLKKLSSSNRFVYRYRTLQRDGGPKYFEANAFRMGEDLSENIMIAFRDIDDVVTAEQQHQLELEERLERERQQNEVLSALGRNYHAIFRIDLLTDSYTEISCREEIRHYYDASEPSASKAFTHLCENIVDSKYAPRMRRFFDMSTLRQRLANREFVETECITKDGNWHRARLIAKRRDEAGNVIRVLYVTQLIDEEKEHEEHLIAKAEDADHANRAKTDFISQVAHDIRTPMNSIFGFLEIAEANMGNWEKVQYSLEKIRVAGQFLKDLVDDVLDVSRMERGMLKLNPVEINLTETLDEFNVSMKNAKFDKKQDFLFDIYHILHDQILIDPLRLKQIYANILSNAIKYTPDGGRVSFTVCQEALPIEGHVRIIATIVDNGIGMSEEFMEKMFNKFERATDTRINTVSGHGLGLSIVKQLVELMDGSMEVQSKLGEGTTVCIKLDVPYVEKNTINETASEEDHSAACAGMHLLIAEDNELNQEVITELLAMYDITCECAENGLLCVERFKNAKAGTYDAILMDMQMPKMSGMEATKNIRALPLPHAKTIPIIAMTASALKGDIQQCLDAGMNRHLSKPVDMKQLLKTLAEINI